MQPEFDKFGDFVAEAKKETRRPGEQDDSGSPYEPHAEPELGEYILNQMTSTYPDQDPDYFGPESGYLLPDGRVVQMGQGGVRGDDHRTVIPSPAAMRRWGWPAEIAKDHEEGTRTPALYELIRRSGAARIHVSHSGGGDLVVHYERPLTRRQKMVIVNYVSANRPAYVTFQPPAFAKTARTEFTKPDVWEIEEFLGV